MAHTRLLNAAQDKVNKHPPSRVGLSQLKFELYWSGHSLRSSVVISGLHIADLLFLVSPYGFLP